MSNGCGCEKGLLRYVKPPLAKYFYKACCLHDNSYDWGGDEASRKLADKQLFLNMLSIIKERETEPWRITRYVLVALLYYISVRIFGRQYFSYK